MITSTSVTELPWAHGSKSGTMRVASTSDGYVQLDAGEFGKCHLPNAVLKKLMIALLKNVKLHEPPLNYTEADHHYAEWNSYAENQERRLTSDFRNFMEVFIYLSSLEFGRTENSIRWKLNRIDLRKHLP